MLSIIFLIVLIIGSIIFVLKKIDYINRIEEDFKFKFSSLKLEKKFVKEEWSPNGDGVKILIFKYEDQNKNITLNQLPIKEDLPPNEIPKEFLEITDGYYKYIVDKNDSRNFKILIIDTLRKEICVYYQIM